MDLPPNSDKAKSSKTGPAAEEKKVDRVTSGDAIRRKPSLGKQFKDTFIGGDAKNAANYVVFGVAVPALRDTAVDALTQGIERFFFGESRSGRRRSPSTHATGHVAYNRMSRPSEPDQRRSMSRRAQAEHDFDEIILPTRQDAEDVLDRMYEVLSRYESVSVADLYTMIGFDSTPLDRKWGWVNLNGAGVSRVRAGFFIDLPTPEEL